MGCAPLDYDRVASGVQSAAERRVNEEGRVLANIITSPQERLDMERAEARDREEKAANDLKETYIRLRDFIYVAEDRIVVLERSLAEAAKTCEWLWLEKIVKPAGQSPVPSRNGQNKKKQAQTPAIENGGLPDGVDANDYERYLSSFRRCADLRAGLAVLSRQADFFKTWKDTLGNAGVLQMGADALREVATKFNQRDARELHERYDQYTQQLRAITQEFAKLHQTGVELNGSSAPSLQSAATAFRLEDSQRLRHELGGGRLGAAPRVQAIEQRPPPPPPASPERLLEATALDS